MSLFKIGENRQLSTSLKSRFLNSFLYFLFIFSFLTLSLEAITFPSDEPFANFFFTSQNGKNVGENIDAIGLSGGLSAGTDLYNVVGSLTGLTDSEVNSALLQMNPSQISAFADIQASMGGEILSLLHRKPRLKCGCGEENRFWGAPFGNWLVQKEKHHQTGFRSHNGGFILGYDREISNKWDLGIATVFSQGHVHWHNKRGNADTRALFGSIYCDYTSDNYYFGANFLGGIDWYDLRRAIKFSWVDRQAVSNFHALDLSGQITAAYFFGSPLCHLFPFATVDIFYLKTESFLEKEADSLNLQVSPYGSLTLKAEAGMGLEFIDKNYQETMCISPLIAFGWSMIHPIDRDTIFARFSGESISFKTVGWKETWNLLSIRFGLIFSYKCFELSGQYHVEVATGGGDPHKNQMGSLTLAWNW